MKNIELLKNFELGQTPEAEKTKEVKEIFNGTRRRLVSVVLRRNDVLAKHQANEPITVLCLAGAGFFRAGEDLEEEVPLRAGTLITLEAKVPHEATAAPELHLLVTKFKED